VLGIGRRHRTEAGSVGRGLGAQLGEVEVRAGAVTDVHGFAKALLGVVSVEDNTVEDDGDTFEDDFDETTYERPTLQSANQCIIYFFRE